MILLNNFSGRPPLPKFSVATLPKLGKGGTLPKFGKGGNKKFAKGGGFPNFFSGSPPLPKFFVATLPKLGKGGPLPYGRGGFLEIQ